METVPTPALLGQTPEQGGRPWLSGRADPQNLPGGGMPLRDIWATLKCSQEPVWGKTPPGQSSEAPPGQAAHPAAGKALLTNGGLMGPEQQFLTGDDLASGGGSGCCCV